MIKDLVKGIDNFKNIESALLAIATAIDNANNLYEWKEIARTKLVSESDTITVDEIPARNYIKIVYHGIISGTALDTILQFNDDTGTNYEYGGGVTNASSIGLDSSTNAGNAFAVLEFANKVDQDKLGWIMHTQANANNDGTASELRSQSWKWNDDTQQVEKVVITNIGATTNFAVGSEIIIYGHD